MNQIIRILLRLGGVFCLLCALVPLVGFGIFNTGSGAMLVLGLALTALPWLWPTALAGRPHLRMVVAVAGCLGLVFCIAVSALMVWRGWFHRPPESGVRAVIVLGAKVNGDQPSLMLRRRLDVAADYLARNPEAVCVVSGGQGPDEDYPEAVVMAEYLLDRGVDGNRLLVEDESTNTWQNLRFSKQLLEQSGIPYGGRTVLVTDGFHQLRASVYAAGEGLTSDNLPSLTPWGLLPSYWLREILGVSWAWVTIRLGVA